MTDSYKEQHPLLCDDYSDEEFDVKNYNYQRRKQLSVRSGRARNYAKGAAAVITRWPDNCSTSVAYWWLGVSMIAIIILVIYNSVLVFGMLPTSDMKPSKYRIFNNEIKPKAQFFAVSDVYIHLIINNSTDALLNKYLPYATAISKKYPDFKYNFLVVLNDTAKDFHDYKDEERNEIAFNSLWVNKKTFYNKYNIYVEHVSLTAYLNDSPIKKFWRHLPSHLLEFLVRSISIWEKGGIAFSPKILIPNFSNSRYIEKLYDVFNIYNNSSSAFVERKIKAKPYPYLKKQPNNIRDIINDLDKNHNNDISNIELSVAEDNDIDFVSHTKKILKSKRNLKYNSEIENHNNSYFNENKNNYVNNINLNHTISNPTNSTHYAENILTLFLKYLFDNKPIKVANTPDVIHLDISTNNTSLIDSSIILNQNQSLPADNILKLSKDGDKKNGNNTNYEESNSNIPTNNFSLLKMNRYENVPELSIDIKGNIIASKTACHAFLGTIFSNIIQHTEEKTLTDFIISELSLFCKGHLTSCLGVNVILV